LAGEDKKTVEVSIFGETYRVRADRDPAQIHQLAAVVDEAMREAADKIPRLGVSRVAVVAALNLADRLATCERHVDQLTSMLGRQLDSGLPDPLGKDDGSCSGSE